MRPHLWVFLWADCIILELKVDHSAKEAIQQIKQKKYALRFKGKLGEESLYTGKILAVGISYDKETKKHSCIVEELYREWRSRECGVASELASVTGEILSVDGAARS